MKMLGVGLLFTGFVFFIWALLEENHFQREKLGIWAELLCDPYYTGGINNLPSWSWHGLYKVGVSVGVTFVALLTLKVGLLVSVFVPLIYVVVFVVFHYINYIRIDS